MRENTLSSALVLRLKSDLSGSVVFKHADGYTSGIPDISVNWCHRTLWVETKLYTPGGARIKASSLQHRNMVRLSRVALARYVIFERKGENWQAWYVHPMFCDNPISPYRQLLEDADQRLMMEWLVNRICDTLRGGE